MGWIDTLINRKGLAASRPSAGQAGQTYYNTDTGFTDYYDGSAWKRQGGVELGYVEATADFSSTSTTYVDVTGMTLTVTVADRPIEIIFNGVTFASALSVLDLQLVEDPAGAATAVPFGTTTHQNSILVPHHRSVRRSPSAGSHTYKLQAKTNTGTFHVGAESNGGVRHFLQIKQL